jgi:hypothetical protein
MTEPAEVAESDLHALIKTHNEKPRVRKIPEYAVTHEAVEFDGKKFMAAVARTLGGEHIANCVYPHSEIPVRDISEPEVGETAL